MEHGSRVALIGSNGAGKTTLLRVMAKIYPPTHGVAEVTGKISSLTDINVGMDGEATGYENVRMRGILLGLTQQQISRLMDDVTEFTELGDYLKLPVRCYSQGMMLRLAFGISTAIQPEIILLDEIIGVGDQAFAGARTRAVAGSDRRRKHLVLATHDTGIITQLCSSAIWLSHGRVVDIGPPAKILERYAKSPAPA